MYEIIPIKTNRLILFNSFVPIMIKLNQYNSNTDSNTDSNSNSESDNASDSNASQRSEQSERAKKSVEFEKTTLFAMIIHLTKIE